jgi:hypothetical protein
MSITRRWISVKTIVESLKQNKSHFLDAQISVMKIAVMSFGLFISNRRPFQKDCLRAYPFILITPGMKKKFKFIDNKSIKKEIVRVT